MTSKKQPPEQPPPPADPLAGQPVEVIIEVLARATGQMQGLDGAALRKHIADVTGQVQTLMTSVEHKMREDATRKEAAAEVERMMDLIVRTGTATGKALDKHREPIAKAFKGMNLQQLAEAMRMLADWMASPTAENEQQAKALMQYIETTLGPMVGYDPQREEERRRQQINQDVKAGLDDIFRGKDQKPAFQYKPKSGAKRDD